jgi:hypothetical protein
VDEGDGDEPGRPERSMSMTDGNDRKPSAVDRRLGLPDWFQTLGRGAWLLVGVAVLLAIAFFLLGLISDLLIPLIFAAILAAIFVPLVDLLERWRLPRRLGAPLVVLLAIGVVWLSGWWSPGSSAATARS